MIKKSTERFAIICAVIFMTAGLAIWLTYTFKNNMLYFMTPSDITEQNLSDIITQGKSIRLGGLVEKNSIHREGVTIYFRIIDNKKKGITVQFNGIPPELFAENKGVIAEGRFLKNNKFEAHLLLAKHDETYKKPE